jgi:hypothetical protein
MTVLALVPLIASVVMTVTGLFLIAVTPREAVPYGFRLDELVGYLVLQTALSGVGVLLAWRRPENTVGWLLSGAAVASAFQYLTAGYAIYGIYSGLMPGAVTAAWIYSFSGLGIGLFVGIVTVTFPDGRIRSKAGRAAGALFIAGVALTGVVLALRPGALTRFPSVENPYGLDNRSEALTLMLAAAMVCAIAWIVLAVKQLIDRAREGTPTERQQLKWFLWSSVVFFGVVVVTAVPLLSAASRNDPATLYVVNLIEALATATLPVSIAIAILRYRLYDIDLLIKRTVVYGTSTAAIATTFFFGIVALQGALRSFTSGSELSVAASTLVSFALFQPVRRRLQRAVDRRFDRSRYDAVRTLDAFSEELRDQVDLDDLRADLMSAVRQTMGPAHASLWLRPGKNAVTISGRPVVRKELA